MDYLSEFVGWPLAILAVFAIAWFVRRWYITVPLVMIGIALIGFPWYSVLMYGFVALAACHIYNQQKDNPPFS